ncbi:4-hydroxy-3-methylbut-2-enyl diphosphate reductase [Candidatus Bipolaricaulota bacterium]|nr:4-hydroxy-3-methylbut-2-enyl diphosphate reductase [Candidatus Bipolaricaulota bacterium]
MKVELAEVYGFCPGVRRAVEMVEAYLQEKGPLATLGAIVHNAQVVEELAQKGARVVEDLAEVGEGAVAITAHGVGPEVFEEIRRRGLSLVDTTCPIVRRAQEAARDLAEEGFFILIYGEEAHPEVRGLLSWTRGRGRATLNPAEVQEIEGNRLALISQTTKGRQEFWSFVAEVVGRLSPRLREVRGLDTTCPETGRRYQAVKELSKKVEALVVVGSRNSANTRKLAEVARQTGLPTFHIERAEELRPEWFRGVGRVGVTAGASTPDALVREVVDRLHQLGGDP